ncbi:uncharacterized protein LOC114173009 isoform X1 [Vigna unguiculata]|uniref:uncharacterized protein LOC114173009 isoform X1 n=1 Tax=Vigna unguiculata TaxID=3917 RepID=UPI001016FABB|nr:uncharacterized protein LOC114173009 isoform X1 [Vigna unguiculata]XP_027912994.1 uncharacterized protein LOC114173009 isoform X1 [Vigna unguiculata]XP_027912995.1 uncharacterized protein LOC114173009 isoform X1 [Vigna unguiculata]
MDYDDNDFQNQNLHLAGEGSAKFPPVLRPYALPKFDFDESLQANLRFDSLVETEVFLGIESNEDNQWIDAFSRGGSGIEFSSTAAESCTISRHGNVWSEATSSESVEMLLKSVGQEDYIPRQTVIQESDACDELACLAKQMDTNSKFEDINEFKDSISDVHPSGGTHASFSELKDVGMDKPEDGLSQGHEGELSFDGTASNPELSDIRRNYDLPMSEGSLSLYTNDKNKNSSQREVEIVDDDSFPIKTQGDSSAVHTNFAESSMNNMHDEKQGPIQEHTNNQDLESSVMDEAVLVDTQTQDGDAVGGDVHHLDKSLHSIPADVTLEGGDVVDGLQTGLGSLESSRGMDSVALSDLQKAAEKSSEGGDQSQNNASEDTMLLKDVVMDDQSVPNTHGLPEISIKDDSISEGQVVEVSNSNCENLSNMQQIMDVTKMTYGGSSVTEEVELLNTGGNVNTVILSSKVEASMVTAEENNISNTSEGNGDDSIGFTNSSVTDLSTKSSILGEPTELCANNDPDRQNEYGKSEQAVSVNDQDQLLNNANHVDTNILSSKLEASVFTAEENNISIISEGISDNRVGGFSSSGVLTVSTKSSILGDSTQMCVSNQSDRQNDSDKCNQLVSVNDESKRVPSDSSQMDCDVDQSHLVDKGVVSSCLSESTLETELMTSSISTYSTPVNKSVSQVVLQNSSLTLHEVDIPPFSEVVSSHEVTSHNDFQGITPVGYSSAKGNEESAGKEAGEAGPSTIIGSSERETAPCPVVTEAEKPQSSDISSQLLCGSDSQQILGTISAVKIGETQGTENDKDIREFAKEISIPQVMCASSDNKSDGVAVSSNKDDNETVQENPDKPSSEKLDDIAPGNQDSISSASVPDSCIDLRETGGGSFPENSSCDPSSTLGSPSQTEKDKNQIKASAKQNTQVSEMINGSSKDTLSTAQDLKENNSSKDERSSTPELKSVTDLSKKDVADVNTEDVDKMQSIPVTETVKKSSATEGFPTSGIGPSKTKAVRKSSHGNQQISDVGAVHSASKATPERKTRRVSNKSAGKESSKRGSRAKDTTLTRQSDRGDKPIKVSLSPSPGFQMMQSNEVQQYGHIESNSTKSFALVNTSTSSLPDLNTSASPVLFHQPFTDVQQVQLRAQIFVYGALIQGTIPDEAYMISAFGGSDGGRGLWENAWRACMERQHGQKSHPPNPETPLQPRSVARSSDLPPKQSAIQGKSISSPLGRTNSKATPPVVNPLIPLSSPLWSLSTLGLGGDSLQSSALARGSVVDYPPAITPLHPYQTTPVRNFLGPNTPWISQTPLRGTWIASPTPAPDNSTHISASPVSDTIKLGPIKVSQPPSSSIKNVTSGLPTSGAGLQSIFAGTASLIDANNMAVSPAQHSSDPKPKKRKKTVVSEDFGQRALQSLASAVGSHSSTSVAVVAPGGNLPITTVEKSVVSVSPLVDQSKNDQNVEKRIMSDESLMKVKEAKDHAEEAAALSAAAVNHTIELWNQLDKHKNSGLMPDIEAKLASAAVAAAAAASIAKAAAAAANVASNAALQAKLMADEALLSSGYDNSSLINQISHSDGTNNLGKATPASILNGANGTSSPGSIIVAAKEAVKRRVDAASAATKRAENMDAIVKAAELAAEAVSQAGKIVSMGDPFTLSQLVEAGPEGCLKSARDSSQQFGNFKDSTRDMANIDNVIDIPETSYAQNRDILSGGGISSSIKTNEKKSRGSKGRKVISDLIKPVDEVHVSTPETEAPFTVSGGFEGLDRSSIKEGLLIEVFKDDEGFKAAWFPANILSLKDGKAYVCYSSLVAAEGAGPLKEWVSLECDGDNPPRIRTARPVTALQYEGTRKRRRAAMGDYAWSVGDRVDAWLQESWREGVVTEKNKKDETTFTVHFPAFGETLVVRAWHLRPSLVWKDGKWIQSSKLGANDSSTHEGDTPQEKRPKLGTHAVEVKGKDKMPKGVDAVESAKSDETTLLNLTENDKVFNIGKNSKNQNKQDAQRTMRNGLQKESKVIFGLPKPGKKRKFMEVSKHYVAHESSKANDTSDSVKLANFLMPPSSGSRGWKNGSKEKHGADSKGKTSTTERIKEYSSHLKNASQSESKVERAPQSTTTTDGTTQAPILFSSLVSSVDALPPKRASSSRASKGKLAPARDKMGKGDTDKALNDNSIKSASDVVEPRRSNRRIQPTSRLLEGLQSSLIISKIPSVSHNRNTKAG